MEVFWYGWNVGNRTAGERIRLFVLKRFLPCYKK